MLRLWPAFTLMSPFSAADKFLCKSHHSFSYRRHSLLLICRPAAEPTELIIPLDENIQTFAAPFVRVNSLCPSLLISFSLDFSLPNILPCPLFLSPPLQHHLLLHHHPPPQGLMGAQQYKFPFIPVAGADDTAALYPTDWRALRCRFTVHGSHSGAAAHLEWSTLTEKQGPTLAQTSVAEQNRWKAAPPSHTHPQNPRSLPPPPEPRSLKLLQRPWKDWIL